jgi:hypothetical protein
MSITSSHEPFQLSSNILLPLLSSITAFSRIELVISSTATRKVDYACLSRKAQPAHFSGT